MKTFITLILNFAFFTITAFAGSGWFSQTSGTSVFLRSVHFTSSTTGWVAGDGGTILKTTNGGDNWLAQSSGTSTNLSSVFFISSSIGWACGGPGTIIKTTNGGDNWFSQTSGTSDGLNSIWFGSSSIGWAVGGPGTILRTSNGGTSWLPLVSGTTEYLFSVCSIGTGTVWAVGSSTLSNVVLKSTNSGNNWTAQVNAGGLSGHFITTTNGIICGLFGRVYITTDGGINWNLNQQFGAGGFRSVYLLSESMGWIAAGSGKIYQTTNGGQFWIKQETNNTNILNDVHFVSPSTGWTVGTNGTILKTTNGGTASFDLNLTILFEGSYNINTGIMKGDTITATLVLLGFPAPSVAPAKGFVDSAGYCKLTFYNADHTTPFYFYIEHRNSITTWSSATKQFSSFSLNYNFTSAASQAAGNNMVLKGTKYCFYSGDVNQDGYIDLTDNTTIYNDAFNFLTGNYAVTDLNQDEIVDLTDELIAYNNSVNFVQEITPFN